MDIQRLSANDLEEALDFINMVFSQTYWPYDFIKILPKLYQPTDEYMRNNFVVKNKGKIRALVGLYPSDIYAGGTALKLGGIGAVSCHPNDRGKGWMKMLMNRCIEEMQREGFDLSFLNAGRRQRYMYYGYEKSGILLEYKINKNNRRHFHEDDSLPVLKFEPMQVSDTQFIKKAKELHDTQPIRCVRPLTEFYLYLLTMNLQPWVSLYPDGSMAGYLVASPERNNIVEIFADNDIAFAAMIRAWFIQQNIQELTVTLPSWEQDGARYLGSMAEEMRVTNNGNWRIFNWKKVVETLLRVRCTDHSLGEGTLCIGIKEYGNIKISVCRGSATCEKTFENPDVELDPLIATRILFGHVPPAYVTAIPQSIEPLVTSWFPLPLSWLPQNYV